MVLQHSLSLMQSAEPVDLLLVLAADLVLLATWCALFFAGELLAFREM